MNAPSARKLEFDPAHRDAIGPISIDRRTVGSGLVDLATGFAEFVDDAPADEWVQPYEEALYVLEGELKIRVNGHTVVGTPGDVIAVEKGATVSASGKVGTRVYFAVVPANWRETMGR
ncbi:cupin domain-containing protein [Amycolatopsis deserti]|nr:cupin domain-containing protein [Amycolatopsis deserti]